MAAVAAAACLALTTAANAAAAMPTARSAVLGGTWGTAIEVPGTGALNQGGNAAVNSVSCASAGNCSAGGAYRDGSGHFQAFVAGEVNGTWGTAIEVPGTAGLNQGRWRPGHLGVVRLGGQLQRRRGLHQRQRRSAGIRGQ
jgi:hypothetical protein